MLLPEADPGYDDDEGGWNVDLNEVVTHRADKLELAGKSGVVAWLRWHPHFDQEEMNDGMEAVVREMQFFFKSFWTVDKF